jgi:hypothetical protein
MPIIEVPGHGQVEFPDDMSDEQIVAAIKKNSLGYKQPSTADRFIQGLKDPIDAGAQLLTKALPDSVVAYGNKANNWLADKTGLVGRLPEGGIDQQVNETAEKFKTDGIDWARMGGNVLSPANLAIASRLPAVTSLSGRVAQGAGGGAAIGALTPTTGSDFWNDKATQVGTSAAFGGVLPMVTGGLSRVISPKASVNPELAMLKAEGVSPTVGQTLGGRFNALEEKLTSVPILGDAISSARGKAQQSFNEVAINRAVAPLGEKVNLSGHAGVQKAGDMISDAYEAGKNAIGHFQLDQQGSAELAALKQMAANLPSRERNQFNNIWQTMQNEVSPNGSFLAESWKRLDSKLTKEAGRFSGASDAYQNQLGDAVKEMQRVLMDNAKRANPDAANLINKADSAWANLVRVEGAATSAKNNGGVFTPAQLGMAVRKSDNSVRDRATARGTALMQDLSTAGQNILGNKIPNSFTTDRALIAGGSLGSYMIDPLIPAGLLSGAAMYSSPAQKAANFLLTQRPSSAKSVANVVRNSSPYLIPAGSGLLDY